MARPTEKPATLRTVSLDGLTVEDEGALAKVALYGRLKRALARSGHAFRVPAPGASLSWDRALFLNLTYWSGGSDVLCDEHPPADVIAHVAWHEVVARQLARTGGAPATASAQAMFLGEAIASAFDLYLVGRLIVDAPNSDFITTQVPMMADRARDAGLPDADFEALMEEVALDPERAFEDMRELLFDAAGALLPCAGAAEAQQALNRFAGHRFHPLLHHFELSNWILYARAYAAPPAGPDPVVQEVDAALRGAPSALAWLAEHWLDGDLAAGG